MRVTCEECNAQYQVADDKIGEHGAKITCKKCGHTIKTSINADKSMINLNQQEFEKKYPEYDVKSFSKEEIGLEKRIDGICNNHYKISLGEDFVEVFRINQQQESELYLVTNISRDYLAQSDIDKLSKGIEVYGSENINSKLEDYE